MFLDLLANSPLKRLASVRELPPIPVTGWQKPQYFPELRGAQCIAVDTETKETDFEHGPGWARGEGHIIGVSVAAIAASGERGKWYFPIRHEVEGQDNLDAANCFGWLREQLHSNVPKIGANFLYDCGWLATENIYPQGPLYDVQFAEALIDEEGLTALDFLGRKYCRRGKLQETCKDWVMRAYPGTKVSEWRGQLWRTPPSLCGPYAEDDADLPLDILPAQWRVMTAENTLDLFKMECRSIPMLVKMRMNGVAVDIGHFERLRKQLEVNIAESYGKLRHETGTNIENVMAPTELVKVFDAMQLPYLKTPTGKPSFKKEWLKLLDHPLGEAINNIREMEKLRDTFIDSYILDRARRDTDDGSRGRIYCSFHPLRGDDGGAKTGRFSSSDPNLQNIPSRTAIGKKVREGVIPEKGHARMHKKDHSQIEYRLFAHYAVGAGADEMRLRYQDDPTTDYHNDTMLAVAQLKSIDLAAMSTDERDRFRKPIKNVNFGLLYGQTEPSLAYKAGWSQAEAKEFFAAYHGARPFVKTTMQAIQSEVQAYGVIVTILNRRTRFNRWEPLDYHKRAGSMSYDHAIAEHGSAIRRAFAYRGVNYKFQGGAADVLKKGMIDCYESGVFDFTGLPKLTVHDELVWSKINDSPAMDEAYRYITHRMEKAIEFRVPLKVDSSEGATWGACK